MKAIERHNILRRLEIAYATTGAQYSAEAIQDLSLSDLREELARAEKQAQEHLEKARLKANLPLAF